MEDVKSQIAVSTFRRRMQLPTLAHNSWTIRYTANYFDVSCYRVQKAFKLRGNKGICSMPPKKAGKSLPLWVITNIRQFYEDDQNPQPLPGKNDFVSVTRTEHIQKRLLLCNLKELYQEFKNKFPQHKVGFSKFCALRPKWCVTVDASGTHAVCVCMIHQDVLLLADATRTGLCCKDMIKMIVCDSDNKMCILHRCPSCPGSNILRSFLESHFSDLD